MIVYDSTIAERYARALFSAAKKQNAIADVMADTANLVPLTQIRAKLQRFLDAPQVPTEAKVDLLTRALKERVHPLMFSLIMLLLRRGRIEYTGPVLRRFHVLAERDQGLFEAQVATARQLSDDERQRLQQALESFTKARLRINYTVDPALIGGIRFSYGEVLIDDTIRGKLRRLRGQLEQAARA